MPPDTWGCNEPPDADLKLPSAAEARKMTESWRTKFTMPADIVKAICKAAGEDYTYEVSIPVKASWQGHLPVIRAKLEEEKYVVTTKEIRDDRSVDGVIPYVLLVSWREGWEPREGE